MDYTCIYSQGTIILCGVLKNAWWIMRAAMKVCNTRSSHLVVIAKYWILPGPGLRVIHWAAIAQQFAWPFQIQVICIAAQPWFSWGLSTLIRPESGLYYRSHDLLFAVYILGRGGLPRPAGRPMPASPAMHLAIASAVLVWSRTYRLLGWLFGGTVVPPY